MARADRCNLGLTGWPLGHSLSPLLHRAALEALGLQGDYQLYPVQPGASCRDALAGLIQRVRSGELAGLNVTIPHKVLVRELVDELTPTARAVGAVNTLFVRGGVLTGENTDVPGFLQAVKTAFPGIYNQREDGPALVLGAGGAARAAAWALVEAGWQVGVAARRPEAAVEIARAFGLLTPRGKVFPLHLDTACLRDWVKNAGVRLVVNATPAGMSGQAEQNPWPAGLPLPLGVAVYDLVYASAETPLVRSAREAGLPAEGGLGMLVEQAGYAFEIWTGQPAPREAMWAAVTGRRSG